jgi:hypothetical protein
MNSSAIERLCHDKSGGFSRSLSAWFGDFDLAEEALELVTMESERRFLERRLEEV